MAVAPRLGFLGRAASSTQQLSPVAAVTAHVPSPALRSTPRTSPKTPNTPKTPVFFSVTPSSTGTSAAATLPSLLRRIVPHPAASSETVASPPAAPEPPVLLGRTGREAQEPQRPRAGRSPALASDCSTAVGEDSPSFLAEKARAAYMDRMRRMGTRFTESSASADRNIPTRAWTAQAVQQRWQIPTLLSGTPALQIPSPNAQREEAQQILANGPTSTSRNVEYAGEASAQDAEATQADADASFSHNTVDVENLCRAAAMQARDAHLARRRRIEERESQSTVPFHI